MANENNNLHVIMPSESASRRRYWFPDHASTTLSLGLSLFGQNSRFRFGLAVVRQSFFGHFSGGSSAKNSWPHSHS